MTGATGNWYCGLHEVMEMAFVLHVLRASDLFVDVGANVGSYSVLATGGVGARSLALEPVPSTFGRLVRNAQINGFGDKMTCMQVGVSSSPGTLAFTADLDTVNHVVGPGEDVAAVKVNVTSLDALLPERDAAVIKIDVEGHELAVLQGAHAVLSSPCLLAVVMETNGSGSRYGIGDEGLFSCMAQHGFDCYQYDPFARELLVSDGGDGNSIFVRDIEAVRERIRSAPRFALVNGEI